MSKLILELLADANNLLKNLDRAQTSVDKFARASDVAGQSLGGSVNRALESFEGLAKGGATAAGVLAGGLVAAATAAVLMTTNAGKQVEAIDQLSQKTGIAVQAIQGWSVIMAENGFQAESLTAGMRTLSKLMIDARDPASQAAVTFEELGISLTALGSTESTIRAVSDRFKDMPDGADKARLAVTLFGKAGLDMIPMLNRGAAAFDASKAAAERFGAVLSGEQVAALNAADDATDRLGIALGGLKVQLGAVFATFVSTLADNLANGIGRVTLAIRAMTDASQKAAETPGVTSLEYLRSLFPLTSKLMESYLRITGPQQAPHAPPPGAPQDSHVAERALAVAEQQEALGQRLLVQHLKVWKTAEYAGHAQEALGKTTVAIIQRETAERNAAFAMQLEQEEQIRNLQFEKVSSGNQSAFDKRMNEIDSLMKLIPELTFEEAALKSIQNREAGEAVLNASRERLQIMQETASVLAVQASTEQSYADHAAAKYRQLGSVFGDVGTARQYAFDAIEANLESSVATLDAQLASGELVWRDYYQKIVQLDLEADTKRRGVAQQFPTFFEQQMQSIVASNAFSVGQIITTWTGGVANAVVTGGDFAKAAWQSTQVALVQGALNTTVQLGAQWALQSSVELGILSATEATKLGLKTSTNAAVVASDAAAATASVSIWTGASAAIVGAYASVAAGFATISAALVGTLTAVGGFVMGVLSAIAEALTATVFGIPYAGAILLGVAAIAVALAATGNLGFKNGGIGDFGSGTPATLHGQEAIIPLNDRGAAFMQEVFGGGRGGRSPVIQSRLYVNGREFARAMSDEQPGALRTMGAF